MLEKKSVAVPWHLRLVSDNTSAEVKNNTFFKFWALQVMRGTVASFNFSQGRVGHTHAREDQGFAKIARKLMRSAVLQDPQDYAERIAEGEAGMHVEHVRGGLPFTAWLQELPSFHGHVPTKGTSKRNEDAPHSFKFVRREALGPLLAGRVKDKAGDDAMNGHPKDVILLVKAYMASGELSQEPLLCLPYSEELRERFGSGRPPATPVRRHVFSQQQTREFLRTAKLMEEKPWELSRAAAYLRKLAPGFKSRGYLTGQAGRSTGAAGDFLGIFA